MEPEQGSPQPSETEETSTLSKLMNVYVAPGEVFESVKAAPKKSALWVLPSVLAVIIGILFVFIVFSDPAIQSQMKENIEKQLEKMIQEGRIPPERVDAARQQMTGWIGSPLGKAVGSLFVTIYVFVSLLLVSLALFLVGKFAFKATVSYGKVMEIVGPSYMINHVLGSIVTMLTVLAMGSLYATPGLALAISEFDPQNNTHLLLSSINIFSLWYLAVLSIGVGKIFATQTGKAAIWVVGLWVGWTLITTFVIQVPGI